MNTISKRVPFLPLLLLLLFLASSCGNQLVEQQEAPVSKDAPAMIVLDKEATPTLPATEQANTEDTAAKEKDTSSKDTVQKETNTIETPATDTAVKDTATNEAPAKESPPKASPAEAPVNKESAINETQEAPAPQSTVTISITSDERKGVILEPTSVDWQEDDSVLDVLKQVTKRNKIPLEYRGSGMLSYVEGIANLYEFDEGASSGWLFKVNGKLATKSAGAVKLNKGDHVEWIYSSELNEDSAEEE